MDKLRLNAEQCPLLSSQQNRCHLEVWLCSYLVSKFTTLSIRKVSVQEVTASL